jgi:hypothetical protein
MWERIKLMIRFLPPAFLSLLTLAASASASDEKQRLHPVPDLDKQVKTGPAVGSKIPAFEAVDQNGKRQSFESLRGPKGLALLFVRSADW